jgi:hypothetical protein
MPPPTDRVQPRERRLALYVLCLVLLANAIVLSPELRTGRLMANDSNLHLSLVKGMVQAVETGGNPLDCWCPGVSFGAATLRTYQPLAHAATALLYFLLGKSVSLVTVFGWMRYLSVVLLPAGFFAAALLLELPPLTAAASAVLAPLISTDLWYGLDYSSYGSGGRGLFPQSVAAVLLLLSLGCGYQALRRGRHGVLAGMLLGLTCACHFIYGWIGAVTLCLLALLPDAEVGRRLRIRRTAFVGTVALTLAAFQLLPVWLDRAILNHSRLEGLWKWDSFGATIVMRALLTGELLDHGRPAILSLLALTGAILIAWRLYRRRRQSAAEVFVLGGAVFWLLVFFGRPTWGPLLLLLGVTRDLHLHRVVGAVHIFLVLLAAIAVGAGWRELARRGHLALTLLLTLIVLAPMLRERVAYMTRTDAQATERLLALDAEEIARDASLANLKAAGGRVYAGNSQGWGPQLQTGGNDFAAYLNMNLIPQASTTYHNLSLTADLFPLFDEQRPAHYALFNVRSVVAPVNPASGLPRFLSPRTGFGRFQIFDAPGAGYFDVVDVPASVAVDKDSFYATNEQWLRSDWVEKRAHLWLDFGTGAPSGMPRLEAAAPVPPTPASAGRAGEINAEQQTREEYAARFTVSRPGFVLFRMTWHPNWVAYVDGKVQRTAMLSPGFVGVPVLPGEHSIRMRYEPGAWKWIMALAGLLVSLAAIALERRGYLTPLGFPRAPADVAPAAAATATATGSIVRPEARHRRSRKGDAS